MDFDYLDKEERESVKRGRRALINQGRYLYPEGGVISDEELIAQLEEDIRNG